MKNSKKKENSDLSKNESQDLANLDKELKELINKNESLKIGINKIFKDITKEKNNKSN